MNANTQAIVTARTYDSHRRQAEGEDWQAVAAELTEDITPDSEREEAFKALSLSPEPACDCRFCQSVNWDEQ